MIGRQKINRSRHSPQPQGRARPLPVRSRRSGPAQGRPSCDGLVRPSCKASTSNKLGNCGSSGGLLSLSWHPLFLCQGLLGLPTHHPCLWQGLGSPPGQDADTASGKTQIFNFSPCLARPRLETPELRKHNTNVTPWNRWVKCGQGRPPRHPSKCITDRPPQVHGLTSRAGGPPQGPLEVHQRPAPTRPPTWPRQVRGLTGRTGGSPHPGTRGQRASY